MKSLENTKSFIAMLPKSSGWVTRPFTFILSVLALSIKKLEIIHLEPEPFAKTD